MVPIMNNLILYKGGITFLLLQNVPESPSPSFSSADDYREFHKAMKACEESAKEITNPELIVETFHGIRWRIKMSEQNSTTETALLKPGDTFPLPKNISFEEFDKCIECDALTSEDCKNSPDDCDVRNRTFIRLYASKEEESQETIDITEYKRRLKEELNECRLLDTLFMGAVFALIDSIDLNKK